MIGLWYFWVNLSIEILLTSSPKSSPTIALACEMIITRYLYHNLHRMLTNLTNTLIDLVWQFGYFWLFIASLLENLFPPIPSELIMPFGGILASKWQMTIIGAILATSLWSTIGSLPYYRLGLYLHKDRMLDLTNKYGKYFFTTREDMEEVYKTFVKYGYGIVFFARFIPLGRGFISLPAGSAQMPFWRFLAYSYAGTAIWSTILVFIGYYFGENQEKITALLGNYDHVILPVAALLVVWFVVRYYLGKRNHSKKL